ncbi:MAG: hypothetical protein HKM94_09315 [Halobacteria archaeon]|nr:hypothetical protein [Halobacteria archaeon]
MKMVWFTNLLVLGITGYWSLSMAIAADFGDQSQRVSLAISGGASKGAYEAGLNWGALKIIRDFSGKDPVLGGEYRPFEAASFAGASAGGINSLLSGMTWCMLPMDEGGLANTIDNNIFREVWLNLDINHLLPPSATSPYYQSDDALLSRMDLITASRSMRKKWNSPSFRAGCRVPLGVTVTRVEPEVLNLGNIKIQNQRFYFPFELVVKPDKTVGFFFDPKTYPSLVDPAMILFPNDSNLPPFAISDQQIETAMLTTSAFPVAFGRKRLQYCRFELATRKAESENQKEKPVKTDSPFQCLPGYEKAEAVFADGGLFDNLPIGLTRILADFHRDAKDNPIPVTYIYLDPDRLRYKISEYEQKTACDGPEPPAACRQLDYSLLSESSLLVGALGTARRYELYRELTSDNWTHNLSELGYYLADLLVENKRKLNCDKYLPYFDRPLNCDDAIRRTGRLLELSYDRTKAPIFPPYSVKRLRQAGIAKRCQDSRAITGLSVGAQCSIDIPDLREAYAEALLEVIRAARLNEEDLEARIKRSQDSPHMDRIIRVTSLGAPITGNLLGSFGAFLDFKFREYDYYVGIYDVIVSASQLICMNHFSPDDQGKAFNKCVNKVGKRIYTDLGLPGDPRGRYVVALLARQEFGNSNRFEFTYKPMPATDKNMHIIHEGLQKALKAGVLTPGEKTSAFFIEKVFFEHLKNEGFEPTPTKDKQMPILTLIMDDPEQWSYELVSRVTDRLVYLEQQGEIIYKEREPDPEKRENTYPGLMGAGSYALRATTYKYPGFTFSPSTAPEEWWWRNVIPFEIGVDLAEGDLLFIWQPPWSLSRYNKLGIRGSLGFAGGLFNTKEEEPRENYLALGLDFNRQTRSGLFSSYGATASWYHTFNEPVIDDQDTAGGDVHVGLLENRLRLGLGTRDFDNTGDTWFFLFSVTDIPGMTYWLSR